MEENGIRIGIAVRRILEAEMAQRNLDEAIDKFDTAVKKRDEYLKELKPDDIVSVWNLVKEEKERKSEKKAPGA